VQSGRQVNGRLPAKLDNDPFRLFQVNDIHDIFQGNQAKAARWLGVTRLKMREKLTEFGLHPGREERSK
jgi:DNA-binding NtrC family response regulator